MKKLTRIDEILKIGLKDIPVQEQFKVYPLWKNWEKIVGAAIAKRSKPDQLVNETLTVSVENSVWLQELEFQKIALLSKINDSMSEGENSKPVKNIVFRMMRP